jgi:ubiquitin-protein ligase
MAISQKRLQKELEIVNNNPIPEIHIAPINNNLKKWQGYILGPKDSLYENGKFEITIDFCDNYPFSPPNIVFLTTILHPNINGKICLNILKKDWNAGLTIQKVLLSILAILSEPNYNNPLNESASFLYKENTELYKETVRKYVKDYAKIDINI